MSKVKNAASAALAKLARNVATFVSDAVQFDSDMLNANATLNVRALSLMVERFSIAGGSLDGDVDPDMMETLATFKREILAQFARALAAFHAVTLDESKSARSQGIPRLNAWEVRLSNALTILCYCAADDVRFLLENNAEGWEAYLSVARDNKREQNGTARKASKSKGKDVPAPVQNVAGTVEEIREVSARQDDAGRLATAIAWLDQIEDRQNLATVLLAYVADISKAAEAHAEGKAARRSTRRKAARNPVTEAVA